MVLRELVDEVQEVGESLLDLGVGDGIRESADAADVRRRGGNAAVNGQSLCGLHGEHRVERVLRSIQMVEALEARLHLSAAVQRNGRIVASGVQRPKRFAHTHAVHQENHLQGER